VPTADRDESSLSPTCTVRNRPKSSPKPAPLDADAHAHQLYRTKSCSAGCKLRSAGASEQQRRCSPRINDAARFLPGVALRHGVQGEEARVGEAVPQHADVAGQARHVFEQPFLAQERLRDVVLVGAVQRLVVCPVG